MEDAEVVSEVENPVVRHASRDIYHDHDGGNEHHDRDCGGGHDHGGQHQSQREYGSAQGPGEGMPPLTLGALRSEHAGEYGRVHQSCRRRSHRARRRNLHHG